MSGKEAKSYCHDICRWASRQGIGLRMAKTARGWDYAWSHGVDGWTTAHTQPVALYMACAMLASDMGGGL